MQEQENEKNVSLLIRDGAGVSNFLRIKSSLPISKHDRGEVKISLSRDYYRMPVFLKVGTLAELLVRSVKNTVPSVQMISFRPKQVIFNLGIGNIWTEEKERTIKELMDSFLTARGLITQWSVHRGRPPKHL